MGHAQPHVLAPGRRLPRRGSSSSSTSSSRNRTPPSSSRTWSTWALETEVEAMIAEREGRGAPSAAVADELCRQVPCPVLVVHGTDDRCQPLARGRRVAELTGGELVVVDGAGHLPHGRDPVTVNRLIIDFIEETTGVEMKTKVWTRGSAGRSGRSTCRPRSGSAMPGATSPSPMSSRGSVPTSRSTGSPSIPSRPCSKPKDSTSTRQVAGSPTSPRTWRRSPA